MMQVMAPEKDPRKWRSDMHRRQRRKNLAVMAVLFAMVALFYVLSIVRMGGG